MASLPEIKLRTGAYANFTRLVFDWPKDVPYTVFPGAGKMTVRFQRPGAARSVGARALRAALGEERRLAHRWQRHRGRVRDRHRFRLSRFQGRQPMSCSTSWRPRPTRAAYAPPGTDKPKVTAMNGALSAGQAKAIADTARPACRPAARQLPNKNKPAEASAKPDAKTAEAKPEAKPADSKPANAPAPPAAEAPANVQVADSRLTKNGAVVTFKGAAAHPSAVFVRGLTAWVVLENAPNFDAATLKTQLGDFAAQVEASSSIRHFRICASP